MGISRQIGWGAKENLLYGISRQVEQLTKVFSRVSISPPTPPPVISTLALTFDNISNADILVGDASSLSDWNTFFDLPTYGNPFTSVSVNGNTVSLIGGSNITIKDSLFSNSAKPESILQIVDTGCIIQCNAGAFSLFYSGTGCYNLTKVHLPNCTVLGNAVFSDCYGITDILLPFDEYISLGNDIFGGCSGITSFVFPNLITVGNWTFYACEGISIINLTNFPKLTTIGTGCFSGIGNLTTINHSILTILGDWSISDCIHLASVNLPSCTSLGSSVGNNDVFSGITGQIITLTVPPALLTCNNYNPDGDIQYLQDNNDVFINTTLGLVLTFYTISSANLLVGDAHNVADWNDFFDLPAYGTPFTSVEVVNTSVNLRGGSNITVKNSLFYTVSLTKVLDTNCIVEIRDKAFSRCTSLTSVVFPVCTITTDEDEWGVFWESGNLTTIIMPELVTAGNYTFQETAITTINLPKLITAGVYCFSYCYLLTTINLPLLEIANSSIFERCTTLTSVNLPALSYIKDNGFFDCNSLMLVDFPLVTSIEYSGFEQCYSVNTFNFPKLTNIGNYCFYNCLELESLYIPICEFLGESVEDNGVFRLITGQNITLTIPTALLTCNTGQPDGDITDLQANNTVTIIQV